MKSYCLKCTKDTENMNPWVWNTSNGRTVILSKCAICGSKNSRFIKNQEAKGLLSNLGIRTPLSKVPILGDILFWMHIKMNEIVNKFLLAGDKFMPEMYLNNRDLLTVLVDHLQKPKKELKNLKKQEKQTILTKMNLISLVFNMTWLMEVLNI